MFPNQKNMVSVAYIIFFHFNDNLVLDLMSTDDNFSLIRERIKVDFLTNEMMILPNKKLLITDYENNNKVSYTIDTIKYIKSLYSGYQIHLIIGVDQFNKFHLWKDYKYILDLVTLQVVARPGDQIIDNNMNFVHTKIINVDVSSSFIRKNIFDIDEISEMLDQSVLKYINSKRLYN